jgi:hypothetical protein
MEAMLPKLQDWITHPTMVMRPLMTKATLRPYLSAIQEARKQPKKHPAWRVDAMLADKLAFSFCRSGSLGSPYLLWAKSVHLELWQDADIRTP